MLDRPHRIQNVTSVAPKAVAREIVQLEGGRTLAFAQTGAGPDLVAIHGTLMTLEDMWLGPVPALAEHFTVTAIDRPGHGFSRRCGHADASPWRQAELIHEAVQHLGLSRPLVLGHSFGATVALAYALLFPTETAGVVALAPMCVPEPRLEQVLFGPRALPAAGRILARANKLLVDPALLPMLWHAVFLPQPMPARFADAFPFILTGNETALMAEGEDALALYPALAGMSARYAGCPVPTRILAGTADLVVNNFGQGALAAMLMPSAKLSWLPGLGHMIHHFATAVVVDAARALAGQA